MVNVDSMISKDKIKSMVEKRGPSLSEEEINERTRNICNDIGSRSYNFLGYQKKFYTRFSKKRVAYSYPRLSCEDIICQYLKCQLEEKLQVKYASRDRIANILFNILPVVKDMNDFVIVRVSFKNLFDSVLTKYVYNKYIKNSGLKRSDKDKFEEYVNKISCCHSGLCLSNVMVEIICRDFDEHIKSRLYSFGLVIYERYIDDILIVMNKYMPQENFLELTTACISEVFGNLPVKLEMRAGNFSYITRRAFRQDAGNYIENFSFLGYEIGLEKGANANIILLKYGVDAKERERFKDILRKAITQYSMDGNLELLRQRIKIYSSIVVVNGVSTVKFDRKKDCILCKYSELIHHPNQLATDTRRFMKGIYFDLYREFGNEVPIPYFLKNSHREPSIYNIFSNLNRRRIILFHDSMGVSSEMIINWMGKLNRVYSGDVQDYYRIVSDYLELIKIE